MARILIDIPREQLADLCRKHGVKTLWLFGSAVSLDGESAAYDAARSDIDMMVEFAPDPPNGRAMAFFSLERELSALFNRPVDLTEPGGLRNPFIRAAVLERRVPLYAAA